MRAHPLLVLLLPVALIGLAGCRGQPAAVIAIDGSSTVFPITEAVAEEFQQGHDARVTVGISGTGGGFTKFCNAEIAVAGASRPIKPSEVEACRANGIEYIELPIAYDGIVVVVHPSNDWVDHLTLSELRTMWQPEAQDHVMHWSDIRPGWPEREIHLFGPGVDSGTYDYFTKAVVGSEHESRGDFTSSEDDNVLVQGIASDPLALGFFGFAYYAENTGRLKLVPIDDGQADNGVGPVLPSVETITDSTYQPLSRPIFIYVNRSAAERSEVQEFVRFFLDQGRVLVREVGYIPLPDRAYELALRRFENRIVGSVFGGEGSRIGVTVEQILSAE